MLRLFVSKSLEAVIRIRLRNYFTEKRIVGDEQFRFKISKSTETAPTSIKEKIAESLQN